MPSDAKESKAKAPAEAKEKKAKAPAAEAPAGEAQAKKAEEAPRPPADPRLKVLKKLRRFLPKGPLRDRKNALLERWNSGEDHGGVTLEELKSLHADWKTAREKKGKPTPA